MKRKLKKGFTLVELVVVTMLMGIITTAILMIMRPAQNHYKNITNKAQEENACITITDVIDGELRYATGIQMYFTDKDGKLSDGSSIPVDAAKYPNYMKLVNDEREMIGNFRARGYAEKGKSSSMSSSASVLNKKQFGDFDYQFDISDTNTTAGKQSITLTITATPMLVTANSVGYDTDRSHTFTETFKLVNIRNKGKVGGKVLGLSLAGDELPEDGIIWIFYALPKDVATSGGGGSNPPPPVAGLGNEGAYDPKQPTLYKKLKDELEEGEVRYDKLVFQSTDHGYQGYWKLKITGTGVTVVRPDGSSATSGEIQVAPDRTVKVYFETTSTASIQILATDWPGGEHPFSETITRTGTFPNDDQVETKYIFAETTSPEPSTIIHDTEYLSPNAVNKHITLHYIKAIGESNSGITISEATEWTTYRINGESHVSSVPVSGDCDIDVNLIRTGASLKVTPNSGHADPVTEVDSPIGRILDESSNNEYWIYDGEVLEAPPAIPDPIVVHYIYAEGDPDCGYYTHLMSGANTVAANDIVLNTQPADMGYNHSEESFDVTFKFKETGAVAFYGKDGAFIQGIDWQTEPKELWIYLNQLYEERPPVVEYNVEKRVHYIQAGTDKGIGFADNDTKSNSAYVQGAPLEERNTDNAGGYQMDRRYDNSHNQDITINFKKSNACVRVFIIDQNGNPTFICDVNANSWDDIYIYKGQIFDQEAWDAKVASMRTVTIHWNSAKLGSYDTGEVDACYVLTSPVSAELTSEYTVTIEEGQSLSLYLRTSWYGQRASATFDYGSSFAEAKEYNIWIYNGQIVLSDGQPEDW